MSFKQISRNDGSEVKIIDKDVANKFKWTWLEDKDENEMFLSEWVGKVDVAAKVLCLLCNDLIKYGKKGKSALRKHSKKDHRGKIAALKNNTTLPSSLTLAAKNGTLCTMPYGAGANIRDGAQCSSRTKEALPKIVSFEDRLAHNNAFIVSFLAEHNLPFTMAPNLIEFARFMAKDSKLLDKVKISRHSTAYKLREGLAHQLLERILFKYCNRHTSQSMLMNAFRINIKRCFLFLCRISLKKTEQWWCSIIDRKVLRLNATSLSSINWLKIFDL